MAGDTAMDEATVRDRLAREFPGWSLAGGAIHREVSMKGFARPLLLANAIGHLAEAADHHPDLAIRYGSLGVSLSTHSAGGITEKDFALAARIEALLV